MSTLLSVNNYYYPRGGAETVFLEHNRLFESSGWRVVPFAMQHPKNYESPWSSFFVDEIEFGSAYSAHGKLVRASKVIYSFEARRKLGRLIDLVSPDICHAHNIYHHISPSILRLLRQRRVPTVLTLHDLKVLCPAYSMLAPDGVCERCRGGRLRNVLLNRCMKGSLALSALAYVEARLHSWLGSYNACVSRFVVPSRFYLEKFCEWGKSRDLFRYVPNFVETDRFQPQFRAGKAFVYIGRLSHEKGLATLVRAAAASGCEVVLVGNGAQREELQELADRLSAPVSFAGYQSGDALRSLISAARAVVLPSEWYENAPVSLLEAYAAGKPVIGARIGGIPELIREGETGLTFASGDAGELVHVLRSMVSMSDAAVAAMGEAGRRWVESEFTPELYYERISRVYRELGLVV